MDEMEKIKLQSIGVSMVDPKDTELIVGWEYTFMEEDWIYSIGQLEDGRWFWTYFDYELYYDENNEKVASSVRPAVEDMLKWASIPVDERLDSVMGIYLFEDPAEMLEDMSLDAEDDDDDFCKFLDWAGMLIEWKIKYEA